MRLADDALGDAAEHEPRHAAPSVRSEDDEIRAALRGFLEHAERAVRRAHDAFDLYAPSRSVFEERRHSLAGVALGERGIREVFNRVRAPMKDDDAPVARRGERERVVERARRDLREVATDDDGLGEVHDGSHCKRGSTRAMTAVRACRARRARACCVVAKALRCRWSRRTSTAAPRPRVELGRNLASVSSSKHMHTTRIAAVTFALLAACVIAPMSPPRDTSGSEDREATEREGGVAADELAELAELEQERCEPDSSGARGACWSSIAKPTSESVADIDRRHAAAAARRAASRPLRRAEEHACAGLSAFDRDQSPFVHRDDIVWVDDIYGRDLRLEGATVSFGRMRGLTSPWLQRVLDCQLARNAVLGETDDNKTCPLALPRVRALARDTAQGIVVDVVSDDPEVAREISARAGLLLER